jgi:sulfur-oxidizing protein SoxA
VLLALIAAGAAAQQRTLPLTVLRSGITFSGPDVQALQADDAANPGMLWVQRGDELWRAAAPGGSCASCHRDAATSMRGVATRYPTADKSSGEVVDLEDRINACRTQRQREPAWPRETEDLVALTIYIAHQSRGMPMAVSIDGPARASFDRGRALYFEKHGQMNLACAQCHDQNWGKRLLAENISQGHGTAFPAYRLEWQSAGSLQRRIRACYFGIRAEMPAPGARELTDLELYLAWRAQGLPIEAPGVRR